MVFCSVCNWPVKLTGSWWKLGQSVNNIQERKRYYKEFKDICRYYKNIIRINPPLFFWI